MNSGTDNGRDSKDERELRAIRERLSKLDQKIDQARGPETFDEAAAGARGRSMSLAFRIATELVAGVFVGGLLGWALDNWLGTAPILLIVCLLLGIAGALLNSVRAAKKMQEPFSRKP
jgi:ATP synthase protein I